MKKSIAIIVGSLLLLVGTISMVTPIPGGTLMLASGSVLLICSSPWFRRCLQILRQKLNWFNRLVTWMEGRMPEKISSILKLTQPGYVPKSGDHGT